MMNNVFAKLKARYNIMCDDRFCSDVLRIVNTNPCFRHNDMNDLAWEECSHQLVNGELYNIRVSFDAIDDDDDENAESAYPSDTVCIDVYVNVNTITVSGKKTTYDLWLGGVELSTADYRVWMGYDQPIEKPRTITPLIIEASVDGISRAEFAEVPKHIPANKGVFEWLEDHLGSVTVDAMCVSVYELSDFVECLNDDAHEMDKWFEDFYKEE